MTGTPNEQHATILELLHRHGWEGPFVHASCGDTEYFTRNGRGYPFAEPQKRFAGRRNPCGPHYSCPYVQLKLRWEPTEQWHLEAEIVQWEYHGVWHSCSEGGPVPEIKVQESLGTVELTERGLSNLDATASETYETNVF